MLESIGKALIDPKEITANKNGRITERQQDRFGGIIWQKKQLWFGVALSGSVPTLGLLFGAVSAFTSGRTDIGYWPIGLFIGSVVMAGLWIVPSMMLYLRWRRLEENLPQETIASGGGTVHWQRKRYILTLDDGKKLNPIFSPDLLPGRYVFYYLPRYHWLLSADPIGSIPKANDLELLNQRLAMANRFLLGALPENRTGRLTSAQGLSVVGRLFGSILVVVTGFLLFLFLLLRDGRWTEGILIIILALGMAAAAAYVSRKSLSSVVDCFHGQVISSEGQVMKIMEEATDDSATYYYKLEGIVYRVNEAGYEALIPRFTYRLYFLPRSQKLVNIEVLSE